MQSNKKEMERISEDPYCHSNTVKLKSAVALKSCSIIPMPSDFSDHLHQSVCSLKVGGLKSWPCLSHHDFL